MNQKKLEKWEKRRAKGKSEFILRDGGVFGLICFGIIVPIINTFVEFIANDFTFAFFDKSFQFRIIIGLIIAFPLGCLIGWLSWETSEWSYLRAKRKSK